MDINGIFSEVFIIMNNLAIVVPTVPYYGYYGGIDIGYLTTGGIIGLMVVVALLLAMLCVMGYILNKEESSMFEKYGVDIGMRIMTILIDILSVVAIIACGFFYYICIDEIISRF